MIINGDAGRIPLGDGLVHCVVTSPPYWSLRKYAGEQERDWPEVLYSPLPGLPEIVIEPVRCALGLEATVEAFIGHLVLVFREVGRVLRDDGVAWVVIGDSFFQSRPKPGRNDFDTMYHNAVELKQPESALSTQPQCLICGRFMRYDDKKGKWFCNHSPKENKGGDLIMVPHRLALALQGDGWVVRNDNVWAKKSPMPESVKGWTWQRCRVKVASMRQTVQGYAVAGNHRDNSGGLAQSVATEWSDCPGCAKCEDTDGYVLRRGSWRHTRSHETVLMLVKGMQYFSDQEKVREESAPSSIARSHLTRLGQGKTADLDNQGGKGLSHNNTTYGTGRNPRSVLTDDSLDELLPLFVEWLKSTDAYTNPDSVFTLAGESYKGSHYAVFPRALIAPLIRATCPARCCPVCGTGWSPVVEKTPANDPKCIRKSPRTWTPEDLNKEHFSGNMISGQIDYSKTNVLGYRPSCECNADYLYGVSRQGRGWFDSVDIAALREVEKIEGCTIAPIPGIVLDPFLGSGTVGMVAKELGLRWAGLDLAHEYLDQQAKVRTQTGARSDALDDLPMFAGDNGYKR